MEPFEAIGLVVGLATALVACLWAMVVVVQVFVAIADWDARLPFVWPLPAIGRLAQRLVRRLSRK